MTVWQSMAFTGGYQDIPHPSLLDEKTGTWLINASTETGKLVPVKYDHNTEQSPEQLGHYGTHDRSVVKWYNRYYWSDNVTATYDSHGDTGIGIPYPATQPSLYAVTATGDGLAEGTYGYCITYMNEHMWEGAPGSLEEWKVDISVTEGKAVKVVFPDTPENVSYIRVWRTADNGADFYLIAQLDATAQSYTDELSDNLLVMGESLSSQDSYPPPEGGRFLTESGGVFFLAVNTASYTRLYFSTLGNPHAWPTLNFQGFSDDITGIVPEFEGVLVFTRNSAYRVTGASDIETVVVQQVPGNQGCVNWHTIAQLDNMPVWMSNDGLCSWDGNAINVLSLGKVNTRGLFPVSATTWDGAYYLFTSSGTLVYDVRNGGIFRRLSTVCEYAWTDQERDQLFVQRNNNSYQLHGGTAVVPLTYRTGHIGGSELTFKRFAEVIVSSDGYLTLNVIVDGKNKLDVMVSSGRTRIKLPHTIVGRWLQLELTGTGSLEELVVLY